MNKSDDNEAEQSGHEAVPVQSEDKNFMEAERSEHEVASVQKEDEKDVDAAFISFLVQDFKEACAYWIEESLAGRRELESAHETLRHELAKLESIVEPTASAIQKLKCQQVTARVKELTDQCTSNDACMEAQIADRRRHLEQTMPELSTSE